jgi:hypothetical protein
VRAGGRPGGRRAGAEHRLPERDLRRALAPRAGAGDDHELQGGAEAHWFAPPLPNNPTERTYTIAAFGGLPYSGTGLFAQGDQDAVAAEGHWYG